jgi:hypothetical protein
VELQGANEQIQRLEVMIREAKSATERVQKEYSTLNEKVCGVHTFSFPQMCVFTSV